jgi:hypothetical protein
MLQACLFAYEDTRACVFSREPFNSGLKPAVFWHGIKR